jgi:hypothetical protein
MLKHICNITEQTQLSMVKPSGQTQLNNSIAILTLPTEKQLQFDMQSISH